MHRPENGRLGDEQWHVPVDDEWTLHVDCAGFVRNVLRHVTKDPFRMSLSDRAFMRAKDFYRFFETSPYTVLDKEDIVESDRRMKWRLVPDLRMVIPGDIIVWRAKGNAAGGAAFTTNDRKDLKHLLKAVRTAQLWHEEEGEWKNLVTRNVSKDPSVRPWVEAVKAQLASIGITKVKQLRANFDSINEKLEEQGVEPLSPEILALMKECAETTALNTGHIVFAAGPAVEKEENVYRIRVVHSTKYGMKDHKGEVTEGVQEYFRRFKLVEGPNGSRWTREMKKVPLAAVIDDGDELDDESDDEDPDDEDNGGADSGTEAEPEEPGDEMAGQGEVEVLTARIGF